MKLEKVFKLIPWLIMAAPIFYFSSCSVISGLIDHQIDQVHLGDSEQQVLHKMGKPDDREICPVSATVGKHGAVYAWNVPTKTR